MTNEEYDLLTKDILKKINAPFDLEPFKVIPPKYIKIKRKDRNRYACLKKRKSLYYYKPFYQRIGYVYREVINLGGY